MTSNVVALDRSVRRGARGKKSAALAGWTALTEQVTGQRVRERAFPYTTSIQVENPFVAAGIAGKDFTKIPVIAGSVHLGDRGVEFTDETHFYEGIWRTPHVAMLDEANRVLIVHNQSDEWNFDWSTFGYAGGTVRVTTESEPAAGPVLFSESVETLSDTATDVSIAPWRLFAAAALPVGVIVSGALLLAGGLAKTPVNPNPYVGLALLLGGIALFVTALLAVKDNLHNS